MNFAQEKIESQEEFKTQDPDQQMTELLQESEANPSVPWSLTFQL